MELAGVPGARTCGHQADQASPDRCELHARLASPGRNLAAQRPGLIHPAERVRVRQRPAKQRQPERQHERQHQWRDVEQHRVDGASRPPLRCLPRALGFHRLWQLHAAERPMVRSDHDQAVRIRRAIRADDRDAVERPRGGEPAGNDHSIRERDAERGPVPAGGPALSQPAAGSRFPSVDGPQVRRQP